MQTLVEDFLQFLRHERGQSDNTAKTYAALLGKFTTWAGKQGLNDWKQVGLKQLMAFLQHERERNLMPVGRASRGTPKQSGGGSSAASPHQNSPRRLSSESVYLEIAALRAFYRFAENEKLLPANPAENLSLPRRWKRLPKALTNAEIEKLLAPESPETPQSLCDQAVLELAYASGLRLSELKNLRLEQLHLEAGFINVIGKGNKERVVPVGRKAVESLQRYIEIGQAKAGHAAHAGKCVSDQTRHAVCHRNVVAAHQAPGSPGGRFAQRHAAHVAAQFRHAFAGTRRGLAGDSGVARSREHQHHGNLHARHRQPAARHPPQISSASPGGVGALRRPGAAARHPCQSFKIVNHNFLHQRFHIFLNEFQMLRMHLIILLSFLVRKDQIQSDLISLIHHRAPAGRHFANVKMEHARDRFKIFICADNQFIGSFCVGGISPENDNVRKHGFI